MAEINEFPPEVTDDENTEYLIFGDIDSGIMRVPEHDIPRITLSELHECSDLPEVFLERVLRDAEVQFIAGENGPEFSRLEVWDALYRNFPPNEVSCIFPFETFVFGQIWKGDSEKEPMTSK